MGVPDWKKKLIVKKEEEFARAQRVEDERLRARREEEEKFNAMPDWKKKLVSLKRADVRFWMSILLDVLCICGCAYMHADIIDNIYILSTCTLY